LTRAPEDWTPEDWIQAALPAYDLEGCDFSMLRTLGDAVARVETPDGPRSLRVNLPESGAGERRAEIYSFLALAHGAGLYVPPPLPDVQGRTVSPMPEERTAVLATWIEGQPSGRHLSPALAAEIGRVTARLHALHSTPQPWHGPVLDATWLRGWWQNEAPKHLEAEQIAPCLPAIQTAAEWLDLHTDEVQVIHADLHFGNLLALPGGAVGLLDFGDCALAHPAFDLAMTEGEFMDFGEGQEYIAAYRSAYAAQTGKAYPLEARQRLSVCTDTAFLLWVYGSANEQVREQKLQWVPGVLERLAGI
jgi:Ser/Thr protein kinase RdoA (MazF antagonist)